MQPHIACLLAYNTHVPVIVPGANNHTMLCFNIYIVIGMMFVYCLVAVNFMLIAMDSTQYLPLFLSVVLFILALFAASISPSFSCDFSIAHNAQTACPIVCSLILGIVVIGLTIFCAVTTSPSSQTWLALNCFHVLFALTCEVRASVLSALGYTHR